MKHLLRQLIGVLLICISLNAAAANRFWVSAVASNFNNTANWSNVSGGPGGFSIPTAADNVTFNGTRVGNCTIDLPGTVLSVTVTAGYTGSIFQGANAIVILNNATLSGGNFIGGSANITIGGNFTLNGGSLTATSAVLEFDGNAAFNSGSFIPNNGTVRFSATGGTTTITGTSPTFYNLEFNGTGFNYNINSAGNFIVTNNLNLTGNLFYNLNNGTIDTRGNINVTNTAAGCGGDALININGTGIQNFNGALIAGQGALPQLMINKASGSLNLFNFPASSNNFTYISGAVNAGTSTYCFADGTTTPYTILGSLNLNNIDFLAITNQTYNITAASTLSAAGDLIIAGTNRVTLNTGNINVNGNIFLTNTSGAGGGTANVNITGAGNQIMDGTAIAISQSRLPFINIIKPGGTLTLKGNISESRSWTYTSGTVDAGSFTSTVVFGGNNLNVTSAGMSFYNVRITGNTITATNNLTIANNLNVTAGNLSPGANTINIAGNWTDYGTGGFNEGTSTVIFSGTVLQTIISPGIENFTNLTINNSGAGIQLNNNLTVATNLNMTRGNVNLNGNVFTLGLSIANNGTLSYTTGTMYGAGTFIRWFKTGVIPNGSVTGLFPMGTAANYRPYFVSAPVAGPTTGGTIRVSYNDATTNTYLPTYPDGAATIVVRKDLNWAVTTGNGLAGGTYNLDIQGTGYGLIGAVSDLRLTRANSVVGLPGVNAGTTSNPQINRTGLTLANLNNTFYIGSINLVSSPLPITLISFSASVQQGIVELNWSTAAEIDNDHFTIQRSKDGQGWEDLKDIPGNGTSSTINYYATTDPTPYTGVSYYRLKQTDIDGKQSFSFVRAVKIEQKFSEIIIFPNPATSLVTIRFPESGRYEVSLLNSNGQLLRNPERSSGNDLVFNVSGLQVGLYLIHIHYGDVNEIKKLMISK